MADGRQEDGRQWIELRLAEKLRAELAKKKFGVDYQ